MAVRKKVVVSIISILLVWSAFICTVAIIARRNSGNKAKSASNKAVYTFCDPTEFKETCTRTLTEVANKNPNATPKDYVMAAIVAIAEEAKKSKDVTVSLKKELPKSAEEDYRFKACEKYLDSALDELEMSLQIANHGKVHTLSERIDDILMWLTAVRVDLSTCLDYMHNPEHKAAMETGLHNTTQLTYNAQDIVNGLVDILKALDIDIQIPSLTSKSFRHRLLQVAEEVKREGFPGWFTATDRKLLAAPGNPNAVVAKDGSGNFMTIRDAVAAYPKGYKGRYFIYVKAGVYDESVTLGKEHLNVTMLGDGRRKTIITGNKNKKLMNIDTDKSATLTVYEAHGFIGKAMTIRNTAGPEGHQAVALMVHARKVAFFDCSIEGGLAVIQDSDLYVRKPLPGQSNVVTADGRQRSSDRSGVVIQNCRIMPDTDLFATRQTVATYLGRPWKPSAQTIIMESELGDLIRPEGYFKWSDDPKKNHHQTCIYREYANRGAGAQTNRRVNWPSFRHITNRNEAKEFTPRHFLEGGLSWLAGTGVPFYAGFAY